MEKVGVIYWPKGGNVEIVARKIYERFDKANADIFDIQSIAVTDLVNYDCLIFGGSTVGAETWQEVTNNNKWYAFFSELDKVNFKDKEVALFGLGDQILYPNNFVDSLAFIKNEFVKRGAKVIGKWSTEGYTFTGSDAVEKDGFFCGLALDEDQQYNMTDERINKWLDQLKAEINAG